jgi:endonuclease V-like protein UPF0215 family
MALMALWRRWLRNVLAAAAVTVVLTATGVLPAAATRLVDLAAFASSSQVPEPLRGDHAVCEDASCGDAPWRYPV